MTKTRNRRVDANKQTRASSSARAQKADDLESATRELANLRALLNERESLIDTLITRASDLERTVLEKDQYANSLNKEMEARQHHIDVLNDAIAERDEHVKHLEERYARTQNRISDDELHLNSIKEIKQRLQALHEENSKLHKSMIEQQEGLNYKSLDKNVLSLTHEVFQLRLLVNSNKEADANLVANQINEQAQKIAELSAELSSREKWGSEISLRAAELTSEVESLRNSTSWRLTRPGRQFTRLLKYVGRQVLTLVKFVIKILIKVGWKCAPGLMHRIKHMHAIQKLRGTVTRVATGDHGQNSTISESNQDGSTNNVPMQTTAPDDPHAINTSVQADSDNKVSDGPTGLKNFTHASQSNSWQPGERIDGPKG